MKLVDDILKEIEQDMKATKQTVAQRNVGYVTEVKDEVVFIDGLADSPYGELITFPGGIQGMVVDLLEDAVGAIVFGDYTAIHEGDEVIGSGDIFKVPVSDAYLGRVVNGIASPIDGKGTIQSSEMAFIDPLAPGVMAREPVSVPVQTGIKAIDALIPVGRGQRELIIGDRRTGKTTIAIDTLLNQKGQNMICIYCAIGQRRANTASVAKLLEDRGAMDYTIIVSASASDSASMQYIAPYVATTIGEYFMNQGKDVLVIYDDLTKHAWAYRQVSLILRRPAGREAYPGDIFYAHSRLLERACRLNADNGGGSLTSLPIIETQEGDLSAYIPTNVISITDGQIFLEADLFNAGIRPAINVGASVSRVGSSAQTKAMKSVAKTLKSDLAQYRELAAFAQFESELDEDTKKLIDRGVRMTQLLKQGKNQPYSLADEVIVFWFGGKGYFDMLHPHEVSECEAQLLRYMHESHQEVGESLEKSKIIDEATEKKLAHIVELFMKKFYPDRDI